MESRGFQQEPRASVESGRGAGILRAFVGQAKPHLSDEHFTVGGTLIDAWASQKSFQKKDGGAEGDGSQFRGQRRRDDTHVSKTDPVLGYPLTPRFREYLIQL